MCAAARGRRCHAERATRQGTARDLRVSRHYCPAPPWRARDMMHRYCSRGCKVSGGVGTHSDSGHVWGRVRPRRRQRGGQRSPGEGRRGDSSSLYPAKHADGMWWWGCVCACACALCVWGWGTGEEGRTPRSRLPTHGWIRGWRHTMRRSGCSRADAGACPSSSSSSWRGAVPRAPAGRGALARPRRRTTQSHRR